MAFLRSLLVSVFVLSTAHGAFAADYNEINAEVTKLLAHAQQRSGSELPPRLDDAPENAAAILQSLDDVETLRELPVGEVDARALFGLTTSAALLLQAIATGGDPAQASPAEEARATDVRRVMVFVMAVSANGSEFAADLLEQKGDALRQDATRMNGLQQIGTGASQVASGAIVTAFQPSTAPDDGLLILQRLAKDIPTFARVLDDEQRAAVADLLTRSRDAPNVDPRLAAAAKDVAEALAAAPPGWKL